MLKESFKELITNVYQMLFFVSLFIYGLVISLSNYRLTEASNPAYFEFGNFIAQYGFVVSLAMPLIIVFVNYRKKKYDHFIKEITKVEKALNINQSK